MLKIISMFSNFTQKENPQIITGLANPNGRNCVHDTILRMFCHCFGFSPEQRYTMIEIVTKFANVATMDFALYEYKGRHNNGFVNRILDFVKTNEIQTTRQKPATFILQVETPNGDSHALGLQMFHDWNTTRWALYDNATEQFVYLPSAKLANEFIESLNYHIQAALCVEEKQTPN